MENRGCIFLLLQNCSLSGCCKVAVKGWLWPSVGSQLDDGGWDWWSLRKCVTHWQRALMIVVTRLHCTLKSSGIFHHGFSDSVYVHIQQCTESQSDAAALEAQLWGSFQLWKVGTNVQNFWVGQPGEHGSAVSSWVCGGHHDWRQRRVVRLSVTLHLGWFQRLFKTLLFPSRSRASQ